jgi:hypothetical protein
MKNLAHLKTGTLAIAALAILSGCGSNPQSPAPAVAPAPAAAAPGAGIPGGCVPLNAASSIGFTATGVNFFNNRVQAGFLKPTGQTVGMVTLTPGIAGQPVAMVPYGAGYSYTGMNLYSGTQITLSMQGGAGAGYNPYYPTPAMPTAPGAGAATGTISLGATFVQGLMQRAFEISAGGAAGGAGWFPGVPSYGYPAPYPQQPGVANPALQNACLSGIGIDLSATLMGYSTSGRLINGSVYFYLNGTQSGLALDF